MNKQMNKQNNTHIYIIIYNYIYIYYNNNIYNIYIPNYMNVSEPGHAEAQLHLDQLL